MAALVERNSEGSLKISQKSETKREIKLGLTSIQASIDSGGH